MNNTLKITPYPQHVVWGNGTVSLGKLGEPNFRINCDKLTGDAAKHAFDKLCDQLCSLFNVKPTKFEGALEISVEISEDIPTEVKKNSEQAYKIKISDKKISIVGYGELGVCYALASLLQILECLHSCRKQYHEQQHQRFYSVYILRKWFHCYSLAA